MSIGEELPEERRRRVGDRRLTDAHRELLRRLTTGDSSTSSKPGWTRSPTPPRSWAASTTTAPAGSR
jgi:hypothetical protein